jgi:molybdenum cofactor cytidylyltransferase
MGQLKALLPWNGVPLIEHQIAALQGAGVDRVVVVLGHEAQQLQGLVEGKEGVTWVVNPDYGEGKTTSIKAGLKALGPDKPAALVVLSVDQPRTSGAIRRLLQQHRQGRSLITIPTYRGKGGHPLVLDSSLLNELRSISEETLGLKAVVRRHQRGSQRVEMDTPEVLLDLNTPEQYQAAQGS